LISNNDVATLAAGLSFTLVTSLGWIDLLGEVTGGGGRYENFEAIAELEILRDRSPDRTP
jgi:hypothetical protein